MIKLAPLRIFSMAMRCIAYSSMCRFMGVVLEKKRWVMVVYMGYSGHANFVSQCHGILAGEMMASRPGDLWWLQADKKQHKSSYRVMRPFRVKQNKHTFSSEMLRGFDWCGLVGPYFGCFFSFSQSIQLSESLQFVAREIQGVWPTPLVFRSARLRPSCFWGNSVWVF